jgi:hypothetical protein
MVIAMAYMLTLPRDISAATIAARSVLLNDLVWGFREAARCTRSRRAWLPGRLAGFGICLAACRRGRVGILRRLFRGRQLRLKLFDPRSLRFDQSCLIIKKRILLALA